MGAAITTTMDAAGRLVIPKAIRDEAALEPGARLRIEVVDGRIELVPQPQVVRIVKKGRLHVAVREEPGPPLTAETVRETLEAIRRERGGS